MDTIDRVLGTGILITGALLLGPAASAIAFLVFMVEFALFAFYVAPRLPLR